MRTHIVTRALHGVALAALVAGFSAGSSAGAEDLRPAWGPDVDALRLESDPSKRLERTWALLSQRPTPTVLRDQLARPLPWKADEKRGRVTWTQAVERTDAAPAQVTVFAEVPATYDVARAWPVLIWLHGGVMRDEDGGGASGLVALSAAAEAGFLLLSPSATKDCPWWSVRGVDLVKGALAELARRYRVDPERVAVAGFSDGASGCFHLLAHAPDAFASFVALMGNPIVSRVVGGPMCLGNAAARPVFALSGGVDQLYPAEQIQPLIEELRRGGADIAWEGLPEAGHDLQAALTKVAEIQAFVSQHPRQALPPKVDWECALPHVDGRRAWVEILAVSAAAPGTPALALQPLPVPAETRRPRLGVSIDRAHEGLGLRIEEVQQGTPAAEAGFRAGDVIVKVGEDDVPAGAAAFFVLRSYLESLASQDGTFVVERGGERVTLTTRPRLLAQDNPPEALGYGLPTGRVVATRVGPSRIELSTRGVAALRLHLARPFVDLDHDLTVLLNGKQVFQGRPSPDAAYLLSEALRGLPGDPLFEATLTLRP